MHQRAPLRVLQLIDRFEPSIGGAELMVKALCVDLRAHGMDVRVVTRNHTGRLPGRDTVDGIPVRRFGRSRIRQVSKLRFIVAAAWHLVRHKESYDILHVQSCVMETDLLPAYLTSLVTRRPYIVHIHNALNLRWMFNPRRSDPLLMATRPNLLPRWFWSRALRAAVQVITIEPESERVLNDLGLSNHRRIPNGVAVRTAPPTPAERLAARRKLGLPEGASLVVFAGVLRRVKNVITLLRAWEVVERSAPDRETRLVILGAADDASMANEEELRRFVLERGLRSVIFTGFVRNVDEYLVAADCFAFPSLVEGMPMALLEAMGTGLPVVVSGIEEHRQLVTSEEVGLVVDPTDHEALAASLLALFDDPERRARLADRALRRIDEGFSNHQSVRRIEGVLREVARNGHLEGLVAR